MSRYDGLIIPRSYSEYINKTDAATLSQALQLPGVMDNVPTAGSNKPVKSGGVASIIQKFSITENITARTLQNGESVIIDVSITPNKYYVGGIYFSNLPTTENLSLNYSDYSGLFANSESSDFSLYKTLSCIGKANQNVLHIALTNYTGHSVNIDNGTMQFNYLEF